jgi:hypothetical protein
MKFYEVRRDIAASPAAVWAILTNARRLVESGLGVTRIEGEIQPGARLKIWSDASPGRAFPLRVAEFEPARRMVWDGGMPLGLFRGVRQYSLAATMQGTSFHMREEFSGLMLPLIWRSMPDLTASFEKFADGLKAAAEAKIQ